MYDPYSPETKCFLRLKPQNSPLNRLKYRYTLCIYKHSKFVYIPSVRSVNELTTNYPKRGVVKIMGHSSPDEWTCDALVVVSAD